MRQAGKMNWEFGVPSIAPRPGLKYHVYVQAFPDRHGKRQVSNLPGIYPVWSHNGRELFFRDGASNQVMVASYKVQGDAFLPDEPRVWSEERLASFSTTRDFDLA